MTRADPTRRGPRLRAAFSAVLALCVAALSGSAGATASIPAGAEEAVQLQRWAPAGPGADPVSGTGPPGPPAVELVHQTAWVPARGIFDLHLRTVTPGEGYVLRVRLHRAVGSSSEVLATGEDGAPTRALYEPRIVELDIGTEVHRLDFAVVADADGTPGDPYVLDPGVYPMEVELRGPDGDHAAGLVTHLVHLPADFEGGGLPVGVLADLRVPPQRAADGRTRLEAPVASDLQASFDALDAFPDVPVSVHLHPETVSALIDARAGVGRAALASLGRLAGADGRNTAEVLRSTFVGFDEAAWVADGHADVLRAELDAGAAALAGADLRVPGQSAILNGPTDEVLMARLFDFGVTRVVMANPLSPTAAAEVEQRGRPGEAAQPGQGTATTGPAPVTIGPGPRRVIELPQQLVLPPADLAVRPVDVQAGLGPLDAHRVLAALALPALHGDRTARQLRLGSDVDLTGPFATTVFAALAARGPLRAVTVSQLFDDERGFSPAASWRSDAPTPRGASEPLGAALAAISARVAGLRSMVPNEQLVDGLEARLLLVPAQELDATIARGLINDVAGAISAVTDTVVLPGDQAFTVTSHRASLPLVIRNDGDRTLDVHLHLRSGELEFTGPNPVPVTLQPGANDLEIPVQTRRSGEFDFVVTVASPDSSITLGEIPVRVQSRAISGVGVLLSAGALVFLVLWWIHNARRRRRLAHGPPHPGRLRSDAPDAPHAEGAPAPQDGHDAAALRITAGPAAHDGRGVAGADGADGALASAPEADVGSDRRDRAGRSR